jgi:CRP-like cAMP-binding protein
MINIKNYFKTLVDISDEDSDLFISKLHRKVCRKKTVILEMGEQENFLSFIEEGVVRLNIPKEDYDFTFGFVFPGSFVSAYDSFLSRQPSLYNIEAITDTSLWQISYDDLRFIYDHTTVGEKIGRLIAEELYNQENEKGAVSIAGQRSEKIRRSHKTAAQSYPKYSA